MRRPADSGRMGGDGYDGCGHRSNDSPLSWMGNVGWIMEGKEIGPSSPKARRYIRLRKARDTAYPKSNPCYKEP